MSDKYKDLSNSKNLKRINIKNKRAHIPREIQIQLLKTSEKEILLIVTKEIRHFISEIIQAEKKKNTRIYTNLSILSRMRSH